MKLVDLVKNKTVVFQYYRDSQLWYEIELDPPDNAFKHGFLFPVPISDIGNAKFNKTEKAILLMRYIKKWKTVLEEMPNEPETKCKK